MKISKTNQEFNVYKCEISWGQLEALQAAMQKNHEGALEAELAAELDWYMKNLPKPGEEEKEEPKKGEEPPASELPEAPSEAPSELPPESSAPPEEVREPAPSPEENLDLEEPPPAE